MRSPGPVAIGEGSPLRSPGGLDASGGDQPRKLPLPPSRGRSPCEATPRGGPARLQDPGLDRAAAMDIRRAVASLPRRQRTALILRYYVDRDL
jgi:hypothetical protein